MISQGICKKNLLWSYHFVILLNVDVTLKKIYLNNNGAQIKTLHITLMFSFSPYISLLFKFTLYTGSKEKCKQLHKWVAFFLFSYIY